MASADTTNNDIVDRTVNNPAFQDRCYRRFLAAAISVMNEDAGAANHEQRRQFSGALFANAISRQVLAMVILVNTTNQANCLADPASLGGNILDNDIDFQVASIFTGIATSRAW